MHNYYRPGDQSLSIEQMCDSLALIRGPEGTSMLDLT